MAGDNLIVIVGLDPQFLNALVALPMTVYREVTVTLKVDADSRALFQVFVDFCAASPQRYLYLREQSREYQEHICADAAVLHRHDRFPFPSIFMASSDGASMRITNIVPQAASEVDIATYNSFVSEFISDLRAFSRTTKLPLSIHCTGAKLTLKDIVPGAKTREFFERYLAHSPTSYHYYDIQRLDAFICAAFRYCRRRPDCCRLQRYLVEVLNWKQSDAEWCCNRIVTGFDLLEMNRDF